MLFFFAGLGYIIWPVAISTFSVVDDAVVMLQNGTDILQELSNIAGSKILTTDPYHNAVSYLIVCFWIFAVIDAYIIGKEKESQDEETSRL